MHLGVNYGVIMDMLDLDAVEVLRGPQGLLFGRNVTGGAVLLRSRRPSGARSAEGTLRMESGSEWRVTGGVERPLIDNVLDVRLSGSFRDDAGWFENKVPGSVQITANTADATVRGLEAEIAAAVGSAATIGAFIGYTDGDYDRVRFDLNGDGSTVGDKDLDLPRLARLSWGLEATYARYVGRRGHLSLRLGLTHRDGSAVTDDNSGVLNGGNMLEASVRYSPTDAIEFAVYGRNLLNEALWLADLDLNPLVDSTFSPLREGRVVGLEVRGFL